MTGTASAYDVRWSTAFITALNWGAGTQVTSPPTPQSAGATELLTIEGLEPGTIYYFAIKTVDQAGNWSQLSNVASDTTSDGSLPENPVLALSLNQLDFGSHLDEQTVIVANAGTGTLIWTVMTDAAWLSADPAGGSTTAESDTMKVTVDRMGLDPGDFAGTVTVTPGSGDPQDIAVAMSVEPPPVVTVSVLPDSADVETLTLQQFTAAVTGTPNTAVIWSVDEGPAWGTIDAAGLFTAPAAVPSPPEATVRATSAVDQSKSASAIVRILSPTPPGFARIPAGSFEMGGDHLVGCGQIPYPVALAEDIFLGQTEVTNLQYMELAQWAYDHGYVTATEDSLKDAMGSTRLLLDLGSPLCEIAFSEGVFRIRNAGHGAYNVDHPVLETTWYGAAAYCDWLSLREELEPAYDHATWSCHEGDPYRAQGYRLPTDAEWEYAAQFDDERSYPWGNDLPDCLQANFTICSSKWTDQVALRVAEKTIGGRGLYDMGGNVWEWCNDWYQCEANPSPEDPPGPVSGSNKVLRGGAWSTGDFLLRCAVRIGSEPTTSNVIYGFRLARTVNP